MAILDTTDFQELVQQNQARILRLCAFYSPDADDRKDLYQEILMQLWKSWERFQGKSSVHTWIYRIALNTAITHVRKRKRHEYTELDQISPLRVEEDIAFEIDKQTQLQALKDAIDRLKPLNRTLALLLLEGLSYEEMAEVTGMTVNNVGVRLNRIKKRLSYLLHQKQ
ncbi:MAG: sigma-70 family RNA polymerase sigma factor [Bacteroidota bacterium]